jgi:hypothetical protein
VAFVGTNYPTMPDGRQVETPAVIGSTWKAADGSIGLGFTNMSRPGDPDGNLKSIRLRVHPVRYTNQWY